MNTTKIFLISVAVGIIVGVGCLTYFNKPTTRAFTSEEICNGSCRVDGYYTSTGERFCDIERGCGWVEGFLDYYCPEW